MASERPPGGPKGPPPTGIVQIKGDPNTDPVAARKVHVEGLAAVVHANGLNQRLGERLGGIDLAQSAVTYTESVLARMAPRDPVEELLICEILATHTRAMHLTDLAMAQRGVDQARVLNEHADRASNTFRRLVLALAEYRKPPKAGDSYTAIKQANIAGQQVVVNSGASPQENATNEQGSSHADESKAPSRKTLQVLPADSIRARVTPSFGGEGKAVGEVHRAKND